MAKKEKKDIVLENLKGFIRLGASTNSPGNIPTGHFNLDFAINYGVLPKDADLSNLEGYDPSVPLGIPLGKLIEIFGEEGGGKSSLAYRIVGYAQKMKHKTAWIDTENSFSSGLAKINGVDEEQVYYADMTNKEDEEITYYAEDILDAIIKLCQSGVKIIVLDSVANMVPKVVFENTADKQTVGVMARLLSSNLGKIANAAAKHGCSVIFINQLREKIGVMWGCFHYNSRVILEDGSSEKIGKIVNQKLPLRVLSYNRKTGEIEPKKIIDYHINGSLKDDERFLQIVTQKRHGNGRSNISCTPNHILFKKIDGEPVEISAGNLEIGDIIMAREPYYLNEDQKQIIYGSILGDGYIKKCKTSPYLRLRHGLEQKDYCVWKKEILHNISSSVNEDKNCCEINTASLSDLSNLYYHDGLLKNKKCTIPSDVINRLDILGLAIWYLDDGNFSGSYSKWGKGKSIIYCSKFINRSQMMPFFDKIGLKCSLTEKGFVFNAENTDKMHSLICKYVPECMQYKLHPKYRGKYSYIIDDNETISNSIVPVKIIDIYEKPLTITNKKFDLTIEDNATYFVDDILVHNSPETSPGGRSLKHNCSLRLQMTKRNSKDANIETIDDDGKTLIVGRNSIVRLVKNRFAKPLFESIDVPVYYEPFFQEIEELMFDCGRQLKVISVYKGIFKWGKYQSEGKRAFIDLIKAKKLNEELFKDLEAKAKETNSFLTPEITQWYNNETKDVKKVKKTVEEDIDNGKTKDSTDGDS